MDWCTRQRILDPSQQRVVRTLAGHSVRCRCLNADAPTSCIDGHGSNVCGSHRICPHDRESDGGHASRTSATWHPWNLESTHLQLVGSCHRKSGTVVHFRHHCRSSFRSVRILFLVPRPFRLRDPTHLVIRSGTMCPLGCHENWHGQCPIFPFHLAEQQPGATGRVAGVCFGADHYLSRSSLASTAHYGSKKLIWSNFKIRR